MDDILDVVGKEELLGKPTGTDIREGSVTLLTLHALQNGSKREAKELADIVRKETKDGGDVSRALEIILGSGAVEAARKRAWEYGEKAKESLGMVTAGPRKLELLKLVDYVLNRES